MATGGKEQVDYSLVKVETITLRYANEKPCCHSIVICQDKIIVLDEGKVKIHRLHDGIFLDKLDSNSTPSDICLMDATTICVLHNDGLIEMASINSENISPVYTIMKSFRLAGVFEFNRTVVRVKDNIVILGDKNDTTYWCIASLDDGHVDAIHRICNLSLWSFVTTHDNIIYISCYAYPGDADDTGVYAFDILNPSKWKHNYKHGRLNSPNSIVINEDGNIFVCNHGRIDDVGPLGLDPCIHQLTASCHLVAIFTQQIPRGLSAMFWDNGRLYVACWMNRDITVFHHVYQGSHKSSEVIKSHESKQPGIEELDMQIAQGNVDNWQSSVETEMPPSGPSPKDSENEKQASAGSMSSPKTSDTDRFVCIAYLLVDVGARVLRHLLSHHTVTSTCTLDQYLSRHKNTINRSRRVFNQSQMYIMFPPNGDDTNLDDYDITLLFAIFQHIVPTLSQQEKDMIKRLREERNKLYGHAMSCQISANDFQTYWNDICSILTTLSQKCLDTAFETKILQEIQCIQASAMPAGSCLHILTTCFESVKDVVDSVKDELQNVTARLQALESNKKSSASES